MPKKTPLAVVQAQLDAYNAKDIDGFLETYAPDAEQYTLHGERLAKGRDEMRPRYQARFAEPNLHARLLSRMATGNVVVDFEVITRDFPEGTGTVEMLCVYEVQEDDSGRNPDGHLSWLTLHRKRASSRQPDEFAEFFHPDSS